MIGGCPRQDLLYRHSCRDRLLRSDCRGDSSHTSGGIDRSSPVWHLILGISTQWNGELYGLALGLVTAGLFFTLGGRLVLPSVLWALSVLSHSEFALAARAFVGAVWMVQPSIAGTKEKLQRVLALLTLAAASCGVVLLAWSWMVGEWADVASLVQWMRRSYEARQLDVADHPEIRRAFKGLLTAYTVAGHYWRNILTGRGAYRAYCFAPATPIGLWLLVPAGVLLVAAAWERSLFLLAVVDYGRPTSSSTGGLCQVSRSITLARCRVLSCWSREVSCISTWRVRGRRSSRC